MPLFGGSRSPLADDYRRATGDRAKVLAEATGPQVALVALPTCFAVRWGAGDWAATGWHEVHSGGWRQESGEMHWRLLDDTRERVQLAHEGRFPEVFRERVQASIALEHFVEVGERGGVLVMARRDLSPTAETPLRWSATAVRGARMSDPEVARAAQQALEQLRADYDL